MADEPVASEQQPPQQQFLMQRIYIKDLSFESPQHRFCSKSSGSPKSTLI